MRKISERHIVKVGFLLLAAGLLSCSRSNDAPIANVELSGFARLTGSAMTQPDEGSGGVGSPQRVEGTELSPELANELRELDQQLTVVVRVLIAPDGKVMGASILESRPEDLELTQRFADEVMESVWEWRYQPATHYGEPVRAVVDLTFSSD